MNITNRLAKPWFVGLALLLGFGSSAGDDHRSALDDAAWRADITEVATAIRDHHPQPFRSIDEAEFLAAYRMLLDDVPNLTDKEIVVRLAALVALIDDGHTRLAIPRQHPALGLEFGHTPTPRPGDARLQFQQLPVAFEQFDDGVYVTGASREHADLIGLRLAAIGDTPIDDAMETVQAITFAENSQLESLMGADRLTLPEALAALGIAASAATVELSFNDRAGVGRTVAVQPLTVAAVDWTTPFDVHPLPLRLRYPDRKFWSEHVDDQNFIYMQMDEIADAEIPLAEFVTTTLREALERDARLVIDVRNNFGGSGGLNRTLVTSIIASEELNQHDRVFVLIGRRTFSAAQMLVNELEQYTRVTFVGEPTGSRPDHFGDPKKIRLAHSGLTLRVSRLHWSSYTAFDDREATNPDFDAHWTAAAYFAGEDPAIATALSIADTSLDSMLRAAFERGDIRQVARYTLDLKLSSKTHRDDFSGVLLKLGNEFKASGKHEVADLAYQVGLYFYPEHKGLKAAISAE